MGYWAARFDRNIFIERDIHIVFAISKSSTTVRTLFSTEDFFRVASIFLNPPNGTFPSAISSSLASETLISSDWMESLLSRGKILSARLHPGSEVVSSLIRLTTVSNSSLPSAAAISL